MSVPKIGASMLLIALTVLFAAPFGHTSNGDPDVAVTPISANEIYGYLPGENLGFLIQSGWDIPAGPRVTGDMYHEIYGKRMTKIEFYLGEKTLLVQAGQGVQLRPRHPPADWPAVAVARPGGDHRPDRQALGREPRNRRFTFARPPRLGAPRSGRPGGARGAEDEGEGQRNHRQAAQCDDFIDQRRDSQGHRDPGRARQLFRVPACPRLSGGPCHGRQFRSPPPALLGATARRQFALITQSADNVSAWRNRIRYWLGKEAAAHILS